MKAKYKALELGFLMKQQRVIVLLLIHLAVMVAGIPEGS